MELNEERSSRESRAQSVTKAPILIDSLGSSIEVDITKQGLLGKGHADHRGPGAEGNPSPVSSSFLFPRPY